MNATQSTLLVTGIVCIIAAIVGGNVTVAEAKFDALSDPVLRSLLAIVGIACAIISLKLPALTAKKVTKQEYLQQLEEAYEKLWTEIEIRSKTANNDVEAMKILQIYGERIRDSRIFLAEWRRWPKPPGDSRVIANLQRLFDAYITALHEFILAADRPDLQAREESLTNVLKATDRYNKAARHYGSEKIAIWGHL